MPSSNQLLILDLLVAFRLNASNLFLLVLEFLMKGIQRKAQFSIRMISMAEATVCASLYQLIVATGRIDRKWGCRSLLSGDKAI
jgi:hypothetical protein